MTNTGPTNAAGEKADARKVLLLLGPPGSGKGTQAERLAQHLNIPAISTGEMIRAEVRGGTELGKKAQAIMITGALLDDSIVNDVVASRLAQPDVTAGFMLDGYPRSVPQAEYLGALLAELGHPQPTVIHIDVANQHLIARTCQRRFCTQCESQGFRHIAFALDRPDVLSRFVVRMEADLEQYPTLLSNGDPIEAGPCPGGRHFAVWRDPYPKPCYLFALVAGTFDVIGDEYVTMSGRKVALAIHVDEGESQRALYAMDALKRAMAGGEKFLFYRQQDDETIFLSRLLFHN